MLRVRVIVASTSPGGGLEIACENFVSNPLGGTGQSWKAGESGKNITHCDPAGFGDFDPDGVVCLPLLCVENDLGGISGGVESHAGTR